MSVKVERKKARIVVIDRDDLRAVVQRVTEGHDLPIEFLYYSSVLEVLGDGGPKAVAGFLSSVAGAGPLLGDVLRWTDREEVARIPAAIVGTESDTAAVNAVVSRDHVRWIDASKLEPELVTWIAVALEVHDIRVFRAQHELIAGQLREARNRLFQGEIEAFTPPEGPPCGPPLPTSIEEIQSLREAKAQFERGLIRAAVRESGSLKDASAALGISYTSLWRRMR